MTIQIVGDMTPISEEQYNLIKEAAATLLEIADVSICNFHFDFNI